MISDTEEMTVRFYNIERAGYYKQEDNSSKHGLCTISDLLDNLQDWIKDKTIENTKTANALPNNSTLPVYCLNVEKSDHGNFLITTWNEIASTDGQVASISKNKVVNDITDVDMTPLPDGNIPGYSTYFWVIPKDNVLATIRFKHLEVGHSRLNLYLRGFLTLYSKYTIKINGSDDKNKYNILGYGEDKDNYDERLHPYFKSRIIRKTTLSSNIINNLANISKITRKKTLDYEVKEDLEGFRKVYKMLFGTDDSTMRRPVPVKFEMNYVPSEEEIVNMIDEWNKNHTQVWDDIGFNFVGDNSVHWLSGEIPTKKFDIKINRHDDELVHATKLLEYLDSQYKDLNKLYSSS